LFNLDGDYLDKKQRDIINRQKEDAEIAKQKLDAEIMGSSNAKFYANINQTLDYCQQICKDQNCLRNCINKRDDSFKLGLNVCFINLCSAL
jgi:hypothetical protein